MDDELREKIGSVAATLVQQALKLGLTWEEIAAVFGLAATSTAHAAAGAGGGEREDCIALARRRLDDAFEQHVRVTFANANSQASLAATEGNALATSARRRRA
jgi:cyanate lyase